MINSYDRRISLRYLSMMAFNTPSLRPLNGVFHVFETVATIAGTLSNGLSL